jgi:hypothetical protein
MPEIAPRDTKLVGQISEGAVLADLLRRGMRVLMPIGSQPRYDFVVELDGCHFVRVQVKTGLLTDGAVHFATSSCQWNGSSKTRGVRRGYAGGADVFACHCPETGGVYYIPVAASPGRGCSLRLAPSRNRQERGVRWARDYEQFPLVP